MIVSQAECPLVQENKIFSPSRTLLLWLSLGMGVWIFFFPTTQRCSSAWAQADAQMEQAVQLYRAQQWDQSLYALQQALRGLRGKSATQRVSVYLYIGLCLYQRRELGLAWKAFEQALSLKYDAHLPKEDANKEAQIFFKKVKDRFLSRLGMVDQGSLSSPGTPTPPGTKRSWGTQGVSPWPWVVLSVSAAALTGGIGLVINAGSNQSELDTWLKNGVAEGQVLAEMETSAQSMRSSISIQNIIGAVSLAVAGLGIAGSVVLFIFERRKQTSSPPRAVTAGSHTSPSVSIPQHSLFSLERE